MQLQYILLLTQLTSHLLPHNSGSQVIFLIRLFHLNPNTGFICFENAENSKWITFNFTYGMENNFATSVVQVKYYTAI